MSMIKTLALTLLEPIIHQIDNRTVPRTWSSWNWDRSPSDMPPLPGFAPRAPRPRASAKATPEEKSDSKEGELRHVLEKSGTINPGAAGQSAGAAGQSAGTATTSGGLAAGPAVKLAGLGELQAAMRPQGRALVIHHWATWCEPCAEEMPLIERLAHRLAGKADVIGVSWDLFEPAGDKGKVVADVRAFANAAGVTWPTLLFTGTPEDLFRGLPLEFQRIPQTKVVDAAGRELRQFDGPLTEVDLESLVQRLEG